MKDEYHKNFININFYGMQSKVQNPMSSPDWKFKPNQTFCVNPEIEDLRKIHEQKKNLRNNTTERAQPKQKEVSPMMR